MNLFHPLSGGLRSDSGVELEFNIDTVFKLTIVTQ